MLIDQRYKNIIENRQRSFPVETVPLARDLGLNVLKVEGWPDNLSGMIKRNANSEQFDIFVNKDHAVTRRRFTIAHEIAHFILHRDLIGDGIVDDALFRSKLPSSIETEANKLAADILMPWHLIRQAMDMGYNNVSHLANAFNVSESAMSIRLGVPAENTSFQTIRRTPSTVSAAN